jgi:hypothetical protein
VSIYEHAFKETAKLGIDLSEVQMRPQHYGDPPDPETDVLIPPFVFNEDSDEEGLPGNAPQSDKDPAAEKMTRWW